MSHELGLPSNGVETIVAQDAARSLSENVEHAPENSPPKLAGSQKRGKKRKRKQGGGKRKKREKTTSKRDRKLAINRSKSNRERKIRDKKVAAADEQDNEVMTRFESAKRVEIIPKLTRGGKQFMILWKTDEETYLTERNLTAGKLNKQEGDGRMIRNQTIILSKNQRDFEKNFKEYGLQVIHLVDNAEWMLGANPSVINFGNLKQYFKTDKLRKFVDEQGNYLSQTMDDINKQMALRDANKPHIVLNIVSEEVSANEKISFELPKVVQNNSIIAILKAAAQEFINSNPLSAKAASFEKRRKLLLLAEKYVILSMKNSFMDIHMDLGATNVFYIVRSGRKIFYVASPTEKNLKLYEEWEKSGGAAGHPEEWLVDQLEGDVKRVEIHPGTLALLPAGLLHFVYTPEDSVVFGGNFLTTDNLPLAFRVAKLEQDCVELEYLDESNVFEKFWETLFFYVECCILEKMIPKPSDDIAKQLYDELKEHIGDKKLKGWYSLEERVKILNDLADLYWPNQKPLDSKDFSYNLPDNASKSVSGSSMGVAQDDIDGGVSGDEEGGGATSDDKDDSEDDEENGDDQ